MSLKPILLTASALAVSASAAMADYSLTVLHTNDFHARFEPISKYNSGCSAESNAEGKCFGGSARLVTAVAEARERSENSILVSGGDQFQGTLFYTYYKGQMAAEFMNLLGYDAMTVGNHEFDDGPEVLRGFMDTINFPILMSNADVSGEELLAGELAKSTVIERNGRQIGLIGLTPQNTDELSSPGDDVIFTDPADAVAGEVAKLEEMGVNIIIVLSHSGYSVDQAVAAAVPAVDIIVGGHTNTLLSNTDDGAEGPYPTMVGNTAIVSAYAYGKYLGELNATFDDDGNLIEASGEPIVMDAGVTENEGAVARIAELAEPLEEIRTTVVASVPAMIDGARENCRYRECEMGVLVAEAMLDRVADQGITIALANAGGIRASFEPGDVTMGQVYSVLPFQNTLATFFVTGDVVLEALENGLAQYDDDTKDGRFPQIAGMRYVYDREAEFGSRVLEVTVMEGGEWVALDPAKEYGMVSNDYIRRGGDGYKMFRGASNVYDFGPDLADVLVEYLVKVGSYTPYLDGRISEN